MILSPSSETSESGVFDVIVCGAGPAGVCAAIASGRAGARTLLLESQGCLGGVWTSGLLCLILDAKVKNGLILEIKDRLSQRGAISDRWLYDVEEMKLLLEELTLAAGVECLLHSRVVAATVTNNRLSGVVVENKSGRQLFQAKVFVDATGDGDLGALAACQYTVGHPDSGLTQPMTMMALVAGVPESAGQPSLKVSTFLPKEDFRQILLGVGHSPSYAQPSLFPLPNGLFCLMIHHGYGYSGLNAADVTAATFEGRREVMAAVEKLRHNVDGWQNLHVVVTANHVGVREGRRIEGLYCLSAEDIAEGKCFDDAVCRAHFPVDVHSLRKQDGGGYDNSGVRSKPYDIPYRALVARDVDGLLLSGRCISGDFYAHASYRVTGNACATGEAAGKAAAFCAREILLPREITWSNGAPRFKAAENCLP